MSVLLKRASSSAASLARSLHRRLTLLDERPPSSAGHPPHSHSHSQPLLPFGREHDDGDDLADGEPSHVLGAPGLRSARIERAWLTLLIEASRNAARSESKPRVLARLLRRCREPALIYTEYRDTLTHLARTLATSSCALLHGGLVADARRDALARFASGEARILLTTDAAGEGLNLQHRCRLVINIELPWNPNRLEQRIGRVDRLGQTRTVHAIHLVAAETAEEQMLTRLTGRVERIAAALGDAPAVLRRPAYETGADDLHATTAAEGLHDDALRTCGTLEGVRRDDIRRNGVTRTSVMPDGDATWDGVTRDSDRLDACRFVSAAATEVAAQLQSMRDLRTRTRGGPGPHGGEADTSSDPLAVLDARAPLIAVTRRRWRCRSLGHRFWRDMWSARASLDSGASGSALDVRLPDALELDGSGLLCIWRAHVDRDDAHERDFARSRPSSPVLIVTHIGCEIPRFSDRAAIGAFVTATIARCRERLAPLLDRELAAARERLDAADRERIERLTWRGDAIEAALAATLRARAIASGALQPLLFEDIASEKTTTAGTPPTAVTARDLHDGRPSMHASTGASVQACEPTTPSLAMVLVIR